MRENFSIMMVQSTLGKMELLSVEILRIRNDFFLRLNFAKKHSLEN